MSIPESCTVLVVGGGPGGSYTASALAREGIDTVLLEADVFPRYHIGESMLASVRHFLRFIDLDSTFDAYGFTKKVGAAFKMSGAAREGYTDFLEAGGPNNYAWNVVRSEADDLIFRHAGKSGAKIFDGTKVNAFKFESSGVDGPEGDGEQRPYSASYTRKSDGTTGAITFKYVVDSSGRVGLLNTKYRKNRKYNQGLKNVASWGYWKGADIYAKDTARENSPFFEALQDESGWAWIIPLHNGTTSVGIVMHQDSSIAKKKALSDSGPLSSKDFYMECMKLAPAILKMLENAELTTEIKSASDYSYSSDSYASPYTRVVGDAGCFIDPYFSSGVHLALMGGLSAATTVAASIRGDLSEAKAAEWHSTKVAEGYMRFLLVVLAAYKQIRRQSEPVLNDFDEGNFDRAFAFFRPIIQGTGDMSNKLTQAELSKTIEFCTTAFQHVAPEDRSAVIEKIDSQLEGASGATDGNMSGAAVAIAQAATEGVTNGSVSNGNAVADAGKKVGGHLTEEEEALVRRIRAKQMVRLEDTFHIDSFSTDAILGYIPNLQKGRLGLIDAVALGKAADAAKMYDMKVDKGADITGAFREVAPASG